jgi:glycosyltransferase involved in cell wall biosynthesis
MENIPAKLKPPMYEGGHVLIITEGLYATSNGGAVVMRNLIAQFSPESLTVLTRDVPRKRSAPVAPEYRVITCRLEPPFIRRGERYWRDFSRPLFESRVMKLVREVRPSIILAVYPGLHFFAAAIRAAQRYGIPWVAYLHDVLAEVYRGTKYELQAAAVQQTMFHSASGILVANHSMANHYQSKYSVSTVPIVIGYSEPIPTVLSPQPMGTPRAFMGGAVYSTNHKAVDRLIRGFEQAGAHFTLATASDWKHLGKWGIDQRSGVEKSIFATRNEYLDALQNQHVLTVGLNWPDESGIPEEELSTALPTKLVEYLASGRPILAHCPDNYGLAKFIEKHQCGVAVTTREVGVVAASAKKLLDGGPEVEQMRMNALRAARLFSMDKIASELKQQLETMASAVKR